MHTNEIQMIQKIDFGEIDGYGDPNLVKYFIDDNYWGNIVNGKVFYVVGKKGTGKSSIYKAIENMAYTQGGLISNTDFGEFPFKKLLQLSDDSFAAPNQYQTVWKNMILQLFAKLIASLNEIDNPYFHEIKDFVASCIGNSVVDLAKHIVTNTNKVNAGLILKILSLGRESTSEVVYNSSEVDLDELNTKLSELIINYFKTARQSTKYIIQFDRLDDNYNQYQTLNTYFDVLISLCKVTYSLNQNFRSVGINNAKVIVYIRSDILREIAKRDPESARWDDFKYTIDWGVKNIIKEWSSSKLYHLINRRIQTSSNELKTYEFKRLFHYDYDDKNIFTQLLVDSMFRPRNLIMFCKILQKEILKSGQLTPYTYRVARREYANWLFNSEIANEINPILKDDFNAVKELLDMCGSNPFTYDEFKQHYDSVHRQIKLPIDELLNFLYDAGVIENCWRDRNQKLLHKSVFRNEGSFNRELMISIVPCVWIGLTA